MLHGLSAGAIAVSVIALLGFHVVPSGYDSVLPFGLTWNTPLDSLKSALESDPDVIVTTDSTVKWGVELRWLGGTWNGAQIHEGMLRGYNSDNSVSSVELQLVPSSAADHVPLFRRTTDLLAEKIGEPIGNRSLDYWSKHYDDMQLSEMAFVEDAAILDRWASEADSTEYEVVSKVTDFSVTVRFTRHQITSDESKEK